MEKICTKYTTPEIPLHGRGAQTVKMCYINIRESRGIHAKISYLRAHIAYCIVLRIFFFYLHTYKHVKIVKNDRRHSPFIEKRRLSRTMCASSLR